MPTSGGRFCVLNVERRRFSARTARTSAWIARSHNACLLGFPGNISCARPVEETILDHTISPPALGTVGTSNRADACAFSGEPQLPRAR